jgi:hypothetical protein
MPACRTRRKVRRRRPMAGWAAARRTEPRDGGGLLRCVNLLWTPRLRPCAERASHNDGGY